MTGGMPGRGAARVGPVLRGLPLAWAAVAVAATVGHVVLVLVAPVDSRVFAVVRGDVIIAPIGLSFAVVGAILARRVPSNPVGWLLGLFGAVFAFGRFGEVYAAQGLLAGLHRPGAALVNWAVVYGWAVGLLAVGAALLHFPDGHLPSRRWRPVRWAALLVAGGVVLQWVLLWPVRAEPLLLKDTSAYPPSADLIADLLELPVVALTVLCAVSLVVRYRASHAIGRLQLRGLFLAVALLVLGFVVFQVTGTSPNSGAPLPAIALLATGLLGIPTAIGVAVLRYRLYDIDRFVSRTVTYGLVLSILAGTYLGLVVAVGELARVLVNESGDVVVAASTLAVAAVARPVLLRVRALVDRRFDRARYDAARTIDAFGRSLRDEVSRDAIADSLRDIVVRTFGASVVGLVVIEE